MDKTVLVWLVYLYQNLYLVNVNIIAKLCKLFEDFLMQLRTTVFIYFTIGNKNIGKNN